MLTIRQERSSSWVGRQVWPALFVVMALLLSMSALFLYAFLPRVFEAHVRDAAATRARSIGEMTAHALATAPTPAEWEQAFEAARSVHDVQYLVATDAEGRMAAVFNPLGAERADFRNVSEVTAGGVYRASVPIAHGPEGGGRLYVGLSMTPYRTEMMRGRKMTGALSLLLLAMAAALMAGAWRQQRLERDHERLGAERLRLRKRQTELERELMRLERAEVELRESEQRYRALFENAMVSAYEDLERQKEELEREVVERKKVEQALRQQTERLKALNEIERGMLGGASPSEIARIILKRLARLAPYCRALVVEYDHAHGEGIVLAHAAPGGAACDGPQRLALSSFEALDGPHETELTYRKEVHPEDASEMAGLGLNSPEVQSTLHAPLVVQGEVLGLLFLGAERPAAFSEAHIEILREVASLMAFSIRQARLAQERKMYESELIVEKERAEEMARLKSSFLTNITHEIRTPLTSIIGFAQILREEAGEVYSEFTGLIEDSARRLLETINSVLDLARLESSDATVRPDLIDIPAEVEHTARLLEPQASAKGIAFNVEHFSRDARAHLDRAGFGRVVMNLVGNAIKFTPQGFVSVETSVEDEHVVLRVRDSGIGISETFLPRIFEEFRQESTGENRAHEGSGIGLSITKKLVDRMGGSIAVESEKGRGSTFTVRFPAFRDQPSPATRLPSGKGAASKPRVLIVEDKEDAVFLLEYALREQYEMQVAPNPAVALRLALAGSFDAVLMDIVLNGEELHTDAAAHLRRLPGYADIPILAFATQVLPGDWQPYLDRGFDGYVEEPFVREVLLGTLESFVIAPGKA